MSKFGREDTLTRITGAAEREQHRLFNACALREALLNAIIHNDYTAEVSPLVEIYSDRLSITSYGGLFAGLTLEECLKGRSMPRNRELMRKSRHRPRNDPALYLGGPHPLIQTGEIKEANLYITAHSTVYNDFGLAQSKPTPRPTPRLAPPPADERPGNGDVNHG